MTEYIDIALSDLVFFFFINGTTCGISKAVTCLLSDQADFDKTCITRPLIEILKRCFFSDFENDALMTP